MMETCKTKLILSVLALENSISKHKTFWNCLQKYRNIKHVLCFIGDHTCRMDIMQRHHFLRKLIRLLEATMNGVQCKVRVSNMTSEWFEPHRGLRHWWRTLLSALHHRPGRCHLKRGARQRHPWHDPLPVFPIPWLRGWHRHDRQRQQRRCVRRTPDSNAKQQEMDWESMRRRRSKGVPPRYDCI